MASTSTRNLTALRASLKHEDAAIESRIPTAKQVDASPTATVTSTKPPEAAMNPKTAAKPSSRVGAKPAARSPRASGTASSAKAVTSKSTARKAATAPSASGPAQAKTVKAAARSVAAKPATPKSVPKPAAAKPIAKPAPSRGTAPARPKATLPKADAPKPTPTKTQAATAEAKQHKREAAQNLKPSKPVKDSFSMSKAEFAQLKSLRATLGKQGLACTKSDLLRAGLGLLSKLELVKAGEAVRALAPLAKSRKAKS